LPPPVAELLPTVPEETVIADTLWRDDHGQDNRNRGRIGGPGQVWQQEGIKRLTLLKSGRAKLVNG
jgi:hypothetical protein